MSLPLAWRVLVSSALVLAAASMLLCAVLVAALRDNSIAGCERQNNLRHELNVVLQSFEQEPRFKRIDCDQAYEFSIRWP